MITYKDVETGVGVNVYNDGTLVGTIKFDGKLWYYQPKGSKAKGERLASMFLVKKSLEGE